RSRASSERRSAIGFRRSAGAGRWLVADRRRLIADVEELPLRPVRVDGTVGQHEAPRARARPADRPLGQVLDPLVGERLLDVPVLDAGVIVLVEEGVAGRVGLETEGDDGVSRWP